MDVKPPANKRRVILIGAGIAFVGLVLVFLAILTGRSAWGDLRFFGGVLIVVGMLAIVWARGGIGGSSGRGNGGRS